jgi:N utilization substance protein A
VIEVEMESIEFGRIAAQTAKQVIVQKVREAEREKVLAQFQEKIGMLVNGTVKRVTPDMIFVDLGDNVEAGMPREEVMPKEAIRNGDRIRALLKEIQPERRNVQIMLSRADNAMLSALFRLEVPEIAEDVIQIKAVARDPGSRAKIAVKTNDGRIDPQGACIGIRGSRVQAITNELAGERVDICLWDENPAQFVINALSPAEVSSIVMDEDTGTMDVAVKETDLSQAIGKGGQNVRLAAKLTGWALNVVADTEMNEKQEKQSQQLKDKFIKHLNIDESLAATLVEEGFNKVEEVAYVAEDELLALFDTETVEKLRESARNALLTMALTGEVEDAEDPAEDLLNMEGMTPELAQKLANAGHSTLDDLAELATDELIAIQDMPEKDAGTLIMKAREHWFNEDSDNNEGA